MDGCGREVPVRRTSETNGAMHIVTERRQMWHFYHEHVRISRIQYNAPRAAAGGQTVMRNGHKGPIQGPDDDLAQRKYGVFGYLRERVGLCGPCNKTVTLLHPDRHTTAAQ